MEVYNEIQKRIKTYRFSYEKNEKPVSNKDDLRKVLESIRRSIRRQYTEYVVPVPNKKNREVGFIIMDTGSRGYASIFIGTTIMIDVKNTNRKEVLEGVLIEKRQKKIPVEVIDDIVEHFADYIFEESA